MAWCVQLKFQEEVKQTNMILLSGLHKYIQATSIQKWVSYSEKYFLFKKLYCIQYIDIMDRRPNTKISAWCGSKWLIKKHQSKFKCLHISTKSNISWLKTKINKSKFLFCFIFTLFFHWKCPYWHYHPTPLLFLFTY